MPDSTIVPIYARIVDGADFRRLSAEARLVLLTLKLSLGPAGIAAVPAATSVLSERTGLSAGVVDEALLELSVREWIVYEAPVLWLVRGLEFDPLRPDRPADRHIVQAAVDACPRLDIVARFKTRYAPFFTSFLEEEETNKQERRRGDLNLPSFFFKGKEITEKELEDLKESEVSKKQGSGHNLHDVLPVAGSHILATGTYRTLNSLLTPRGCDALAAIMGRCRRPSAFLAELEGCLSGMRPGIPTPVPADALEMALLDLNTNGVDRVDARVLRAYLVSAIREHTRLTTPTASTHGRVDVFTARLKELEARGEA